ncbi:hypothetical protein A2619_02670 [candidate division WWE3 bacterium RIFOXYD1_FULL_39_9]|uniref:Uncharacterized protein n=1 Tax=candidate division WWE3 bacterium RIFOXYD1_FULL_39_9 TaxID=1802649 RepID=A0A1F4XAY0_UNCKA|nr:MAG: hypothetical protein A2619_02670 [candidate division WWE3 bacterium RIFOXYD1_FULL_39_9]
MAPNGNYGEDPICSKQSPSVKITIVWGKNSKEFLITLGWQFGIVLDAPEDELYDFMYEQIATKLSEVESQVWLQADFMQIFVTTMCENCGGQVLPLLFDVREMNEVYDEPTGPTILTENGEELPAFIFVTEETVDAYMQVLRNVLYGDNSGEESDKYYSTTGQDIDIMPSTSQVPDELNGFFLMT